MAIRCHSFLTKKNITYSRYELPFNDLQHISSQLSSESYLIYLINLQLTQMELQNLTLIEIEKLLNQNSRSLKQFPSLPYHDKCVIAQVSNRLIHS